MAKKVAINSRLGELIDSRRFGWLPPGKLSVSEWADEYRYLSPESSSEHGKFKTARTPYMKEAMDIVLDPHIHTIVWKKSAQVGYTEYLLNVIGYFIERNPSPMLVVFPIEKIAESFSLDRLTPMVRDTPVLTKRILPYKAGQSENSKLYKKFPGGHVTLAGANSPSSLASRPIKIVLCDEIDRFPPSSGDEGDPIALAEKRSTTYFDRKLILGSTPTVKGASRIDLAYSHSDQRQYFCPCIHCNEYFVFKWEYVKWPKDDFVKAYLQCPKCFGKIDDRQKIDMLSRGKWEPTKVGHRGIAGFHINEIYSPWVSLASLVDSFLKAKKDVQTLKVWTNTSLGEVWEEDSESLDDLPLKNRAEVYPAEVPTGVLFLTAGWTCRGTGSKS